MYSHSQGPGQESFIVTQSKQRKILLVFSEAEVSQHLPHGMHVDL